MALLIFYIISLILASILSAVFGYIGYYGLLLLSLSAVLFFSYKLIMLHISTQKKVSFMFNAIDCDDYTFKFTDNYRGINNYMLNHSLNRIKEIMTNAKVRAIEREKYYELIMNSVKTGVITINKNGNIYQANNEVLKIVGLTVFTHINQLKNSHPELIKILNEIQSGEKKRYSLYNERGEIQLSITASDMFFDGKELKIISINDINSDMDENEVESWIKLTRVLTHEIMNSLAPITSLSETLIDINDNNSPEIKNGLETIKNTGNSLISFVDSYRKFTRLQTPVKAPFELRQFVSNVVSLYIPCNIIVDMSIDPLDLMIYADKDMVNQVISNIIKNAVYAVESRAEDDSFVPKIGINSTILPNENILLCISNNGGAIPSDIAKDIFTPFFTTKDEGTGIGLSVSRQIMHLHGGQLNLTSNTDSKVTFSLMFI